MTKPNIKGAIVPRQPTQRHTPTTYPQSADGLGDESLPFQFLVIFGE